MLKNKLGTWLGASALALTAVNLGFVALNTYNINLLSEDAKALALIDVAQCEDGLQGLAGTAGDQGTQGATGETGSQGETGEQGTPGEKGDKGESGETGATGSEGIQGSTGSSGATGSAQISLATSVVGTPSIERLSEVATASSMMHGRDEVDDWSHAGE